MLQVLGLQHCHDGCHAQTVVGTQRRAFRLHPIPVHVGLDGILGEVVHRVIILLRHHVHVGLQDDSLAVLHTRGGRLADDDIACLVHKGFQAQALTKVYQIFGDLLYMSRRTRDAGQLIEMLPHVLWSQL